VLIVAGSDAWNGSNQIKGSGFFSSALATQMLLGLILYIFFSPITQSAFQNFNSAMDSSVARFFTIEHPLYMLVVVVLVHIGSARSSKISDPAAKHRNVALFFTSAVLVILIAIPWSRPLFPGLGRV